MSEIEFGIGLRNIANVVTEARAAEALGYHFFTCGEHVFFHGAVDNALIALAAAGGATSTIQLMTTIALVPLYPPALLAKQVATLDQACNGRFHLGVGVGGEFEKEFAACGVPVHQRGARTDESLELMQRLWTTSDVTFAGQFTTVEMLTLDPKPVQSPHPPLWISGRSEAAMRRCARFGNGWLPYMYTPERLAASVDSISQQCARIERSAPVRTGVFIFFAVHEDRKRAIEMASEHLSEQYNQDFSSLVGKYALAGDPQTCIERLREYIDAGARTIILNSACNDDYAAHNEALLASEVLPALRRD